jgi:4-phytase / acid phosphatase
VGYLTPRGRQAATLLGAYFFDYLLYEGLLTGNTTTDMARLYFHANSIQRSNVTASYFGAGLIPGATVPVHSYALGATDPVFDPVAAGVATVDPARAVAEVQGIYGSGTALASAYSGELALVRSVLYPPGTQPINPAGSQPPPNAPPGPQGSYDPTSIAFTFTANTPVTNAGASIKLGGLAYVQEALDPFVMQYADNFNSADVAWGRLTPDTLSQETRLVVQQINIQMRLPYISQVQSSNAASHVFRSMSQVISGSSLRGAFGTSKSKILAIISSDYYVAGLAGLLGLHWNLPGYQPDFCAPGGALVFELRQSKTTKEHLVRVFYTAQTFDQLRNLTSLTLQAPPATMQLMVPGGSNSAMDLDVKWATFKKLMTDAIDLKYVQPYGKDNPPGVLSNVPLD